MTVYNVAFLELYFYLKKGGMSNHLNQLRKTIFRCIKPMDSYPPSSMESEISNLGGIKSTHSSGFFSTFIVGSTHIWNLHSQPPEMV